MLKLSGLYYITHIENLSSILKNCILSHNRVISSGITPKQIYDEEIVNCRKGKTTPDGKSLWDFVNLYLQPRNAMLYRVVSPSSGVKPEDIIIIGIKDSNILCRNDVFVTTGNAASQDTRISPVQGKLVASIRKQVDKDWWSTIDDSKRELMAECLVPDNVASSYISEIYVSNNVTMEKVRKICEDNNQNIPVIPEPDLFFSPSRRIILTENLSLIQGDMFFSRMQTLTISVNTVGVMGKGLASRAKFRFQDMYVKYQELCTNGKLKMGKPYLYKREKSAESMLVDDSAGFVPYDSQTWLLLFPTKTYWRENSDFKGIEEGLKWLVSEYTNLGIKSLAVPSLGCGLGGLKWSFVGPMLCSYLQQLDIMVEIYLPLEQTIPDEQLSEDFLINKRTVMF